MSSFTKKLIVSPTDDGSNWILMESFSYYLKDKSFTIDINKGFITDFASIPRLVWIFLPPYQKIYGKASIIHDFLCEKARINKFGSLKPKHVNFGYHNFTSGKTKYYINGELLTRKRADDIFLEAMKVNAKTALDHFKVGLIYYSVRFYAILMRL